SIPLLTESSLSAGHPAEPRPFRPGVWSVLEDGRSAPVPALAPSPSSSEQPPRRDSAPGGSVTAWDAEPVWEALSPVFAAGGPPRRGRLRAGRGFNQTPPGGTASSPGGVATRGPARAAGPPGAAPAAAGATLGPDSGAPSPVLGNGNEPASEPAAAPEMLAAVG